MEEDHSSTHSILASCGIFFLEKKISVTAKKKRSSTVMAGKDCGKVCLFVCVSLDVLSLSVCLLVYVS